MALLILTPFFFRNYYLSGYLFFPSASIDVFTPDWKIPSNIVDAEKQHIAAWAKIPRIEVARVDAMKTTEWLPIWWQRKSLPFKALLAGAALSFISFFFLIKQKKAKELVLLAIVWANLLFWFYTAPDPRFVHGFLIFSFALGLATLLAFITPAKILSPTFVLPTLILLAFGSIVTIREKPKDMFLEHGVLPKAVGENPLMQFSSPFPHTVPMGNNRCYNADLPCLPYENVFSVQRGTTFKDGFKTSNIQPEALKN